MAVGIAAAGAQGGIRVATKIGVRSVRRRIPQPCI
jgi:hypothetical protein